MLKLAERGLEMSKMQCNADGDVVAASHFARHEYELSVRCDRLFAGLLIVQWLAGVIVAAWISPQTWDVDRATAHLHIYAAMFCGGAIVAMPLFLIARRPGQPLTRHVIAVAQMLWSALLIHLSGGRIETHFHIFGSLALLAF